MTAACDNGIDETSTLEETQ